MQFLIYTALILSFAAYCLAEEVCQLERIVDVAADKDNEEFEVDFQPSQISVTGCHGSLLRIDRVCLDVKCAAKVSLSMIGEKPPCMVTKIPLQAGQYFMSSNCNGGGSYRSGEVIPENGEGNICIETSARRLESLTVNIQKLDNCEAAYENVQIIRCE